MIGPLRIPLAACLALGVTACGANSPEAEGAKAARQLLTAAWAEDAQGFEARIDRPAVREDLRRQLAQVAQANTLLVEGGASNATLDRMVTPAAFRLTDEQGAPLTAAPTDAQLAQMVSPLGKDRACLHPVAETGPCLLVFGHGQDGWRLVGMAPAGFTIEVPPEPGKAG